MCTAWCLSPNNSELCCNVLGAAEALQCSGNNWAWAGPGSFCRMDPGRQWSRTLRSTVLSGGLETQCLTKVESGEKVQYSARPYPASQCLQEGPRHYSRTALKCASSAQNSARQWCKLLHWHWMLDQKFTVCNTMLRVVECSVGQGLQITIHGSGLLTEGHLLKCDGHLVYQGNLLVDIGHSVWRLDIGHMC